MSAWDRDGNFARRDVLKFPGEWNFDRVALLAQDAPEVPEGICSEVLSNAPSTLPTRPPTHPRPSLRRSSFRALRPGKGGASFKAVVSVRALNLLVEMHLAPTRA